MKNQTKVFASLLMLVLSSFFIGCSDDPQPALEYKTEGYIKGKIVGVSYDNSYAFSDDFNYSQYLSLGGIESYYQINDDGSYYIGLIRSDYSSRGSVKLEFKITNTTEVIPVQSYWYVEYYKELNDKIVKFNMSSSNNTVVITDFTFDAATGKVKGKYTLSGSTNSTHKNATVSGDFDLTAKKRVQ